MKIFNKIDVDAHGQYFNKSIFTWNIAFLWSIALLAIFLTQHYERWIEFM